MNYKLKWTHFEPLYSVFLNTQNSSQVMFKKKLCKRHMSKIKIMHSEFTWKRNTYSVLVTTPTPPSHQI